MNALKQIEKEEAARDALTLDEVVHVRLTQNEKTQLQRFARDHERPVSVVVRASILSLMQPS